ncbi:MAG: hypothetical protein IKI04_00195, partial [Bacilli bacterium]|nr:hypothetical protein [Bacilli bacterium]
VNKDSLIEMLIDDGKLSVNEVLDGLNKENRKSLVDDIYHKNSNFFVNEILPNLTKQEVGLYLNVDNIGYLSNDNIIKVRESYSDIVDSILGNVDSLITEVARDTNNPLFGKLLNPEGNMAFFGNLTRNDVISKISDYIIRNHDILRNTMNTNNYLEVPELRRLILNNNTMLEIIGNNNNRQMIDKLDDAEIYSRMRQLSSISDITLYNQYMSAVLSASKTVNRLNAIDVINYYMRNATFSDITEIEQVKKALVISDIVEGILGDNLLSITDGTIHFKADTLDMVTANNMLSYIDCLEKLTSNGVDILGLMNKEQVELFSKVIPCVKNELARVTNNTNGNITVNQHAVANVMTSTDINARSVREDLISKVKDKYIGITRRQAEAFLMTMEAIPGNDGICNYADVASAIFERYINDIDGQVKFEKTFGFKMYKDGHLNEAELLTDMYLRVTGDEIISRESDGTYTVANNNIGYIHLTDVIESNTTYRLDQIQKYLNEKGIYVDSETLKQHRIIDTINNKVNSSEIDTIKNNIIEEVTEALNKGNHVSISSNPGLYMRNIATNSPAHVSETHIMTVYGIDSQGRLLVEANVNNRVNKYSVDIGSALSDGVGITIDTLSMDLSKQLSMSE